MVKGAEGPRVGNICILQYSIRVCQWQTLPLSVTLVQFRGSHFVNGRVERCLRPVDADGDHVALADRHGVRREHFGPERVCELRELSERVRFDNQPGNVGPRIPNRSLGVPMGRDAVGSRHTTYFPNLTSVRNNGATRVAKKMGAAAPTLFGAIKLLVNNQTTISE